MAVARKAFVATLVSVGVLVAAIALWEVRTVIALLFVGLILAAAMRPGVEWLHERRVPRAAGVLLHYLALLGVFALLVWLIVPQALGEVQQALHGEGAVSEVHQAAASTNGVEQRFLVALDRRLRHLPSASELGHPALTVTTTALAVLAGILFTLAVAAYWILERRPFAAGRPGHGVDGGDPVRTVVRPALRTDCSSCYNSDRCGRA